MKVLVFSHYYYPEGNAPASRMTALCAHWAENGHVYLTGEAVEVFSGEWVED